MTSFRDAYNDMPGDMADANTKVSNCAICILFDDGAVGSCRDGIIGVNNWEINATQALTNLNNAPPADVGGETFLFWTELAHAGLLSCITDDGHTEAGVPAIGKALPSARIGGGWIVGHSAGTACFNTLGRQVVFGILTAVYPVTIIDSVIILAPDATDALTNLASRQILTPVQATQMDAKMDDGSPQSGTVQSYGNPFTCMSGPRYSEQIDSKDCGLIFGIQH